MKNEIGCGMFIVAFAVLFLVMMFQPMIACDRMWTDSNIEHRFVFFGGGCQLNIDGSWVPDSAYRVAP